MAAARMVVVRKTATIEEEMRANIVYEIVGEVK